jgi:hypothetical protein
VFADVPAAPFWLSVLWVELDAPVVPVVLEPLIVAAVPVPAVLGVVAVDGLVTLLLAASVVAPIPEVDVERPEAASAEAVTVKAAQVKISFFIEPPI